MRWRVIGVSFALSGVLTTGMGWSATDEKTEWFDEIVVTGTKTPHALKDAPVETVLVSRTDIEKSNAQTVGDLLKSVPGINSSGISDLFGDGTSRVRMQGLELNTGYGLILIDGQRIHGAGQSGAHGEYGVGLNQIPISMIERIEVVKGPSSVLYGSDAVAGVINVITRKTPAEMVAGASASYGWYTINEQNRSGVVTKTSDGGDRNESEYSLYFGDRPSERFGYLLSYANENAEGTGTDPADSTRHSVMLKTDFTLNDAVDTWLKGEVSRFERDGSSPLTEDSYRISAGGSWQLSDSSQFQLKGYHYRDDFDKLSSSSQSVGFIGYDQIEGQYSWTLSKTQTLTLGTELQQQTIDYNIYNSNGSLTPVHEDVVTWSLYGQDELTLFDDLTLIPGVRYEHHSTFGDSINPKLSMMYRFQENTILRASVGRAFKSPTIRQLYYDQPFYHSPFWMVSNPDLEPETSIGYSAGVEQWLWDSRLVVNLGYFRNDIDNMVVTEIADTTYNDQELRVFRNVDEAMTQGVELSARALLSDELSVTASYSYTDSENKESGMELTYTPQHQIALTPSYEIKALGLGCSATLNYSSRQYADTSNTIEIDDFVEVDANIYKRIGDRAKLTLQADNIFDTDYGSEYYARVGQTLVLKMDVEL